MSDLISLVGQLLGTPANYGASGLETSRRAPQEAVDDCNTPDLPENDVQIRGKRCWTGDLWNMYRSFVRKHLQTFDLAENAIEQVLFWMPHSYASSARHQWREVVYGLLSLNRLALDLATEDHIVNSYGTSIRTNQNPRIPATALRIALTVLHSLMPCVMELVDRKRTEKTRLFLERQKFVLRLILMLSYWHQRLKLEHNEDHDATPIGILQNGGMYYSAEEEGISVAQEQAYCKRRDYVGRRTGRRVVLATPAARKGLLTPRQRAGLTIVGELLFAYRPLYWAKVEASLSRPRHNRRKLRLAWMLTLVMDLVSLQCIEKSASTQMERKRRKVKLLLYLFRNPMWNELTEPSMLRLTSILEKIPLLGKLVEVYLWDWLWYWKQPYVAEEG